MSAHIARIAPEVVKAFAANIPEDLLGDATDLMRDTVIAEGDRWAGITVARFQMADGTIVLAQCDKDRVWLTADALFVAGFPVRPFLVA